MTTPLKHCTNTFFQGGSPWASLILNSMILLGILYCVQLLFWGENFPNYVSLANAIAFVSYFLGSILLGSFLFLLVFAFDVFISFFWKSLHDELFQNIWCLLKILLNHCTQTMFQGGSPWASLILNSMIVPGVLYCVQPFSEVKKKCSFILSFSFSFCFLFSLHLFENLFMFLFHSY